jgi:hypothetical protein
MLAKKKFGGNSDTNRFVLIATWVMKSFTTTEVKKSDILLLPSLLPQDPDAYLTSSRYWNRRTRTNSHSA